MQIISQEANFSAPFWFTSAENMRPVESQKVNHLVDKIFSFRDTRLVVRFPISTK